MAARAKKKSFWRSDLLTPSACTTGILSTFTYTEFDCAALLALLQLIINYQNIPCSPWSDNAPCSCNDLFTFLSQNHVPTPIVSFLTDSQYSKHFQRSGKWSYVFLEGIATYINREGKIKINLFTSFFFWCFLTLTLLHLFKWRIPFRREQYKNPVLNSATNLQIWHFPNRNKIFLCLNFWFVFLFRQALSQSSSTIRAIILRYFCNFASRLLCKPHLEEFSKNICVL